MNATATATATANVTAPVPFTVDETGSGRPVLLLHGGAGPASMRPFAALLAERHSARVLLPTHPGFDGTPRPATLDGIRALAAAYTALLAERGLTGVTVVGNSIGGWIAAEMGLLDEGRIAASVILNGVGITVPGHPLADFFALRPDEVAALSFHDPARSPLAAADRFTQAQRATMAANRETLSTYAGREMADPTLAGRLAATRVPTLVAWGTADRIASLGYGEAYAAAIPGAVFQPLADTGHLPQLETPETVLAAVAEFTTP
ncbi:alpha/beta fold hydrolase [Streptomyces goshikiensis]|uniref:alpha/beta fold hydrolase n=1 Tax=Streptomyces goshikiensis TaxID=1942 RepID=UPI00371851CC